MPVAGISAPRWGARDSIAVVLALAAGLAIGWADSRPGWDDTGVTVGLLLAASVVAAFVAGRRPWLIAIATGIWVPLLEWPSIGSGGPLAALAIAAIGATIGWVLRGQVASQS